MLSKKIELKWTLIKSTLTKLKTFLFWFCFILLRHFLSFLFFQLLLRPEPLFLTWEVIAHQDSTLEGDERPGGIGTVVHLPLALEHFHRVTLPVGDDSVRPQQNRYLVNVSRCRVIAV